MNFFDHQEQARKNTTRLIFLFALGVLGIVISTYFIASIAFRGSWSFDPSLFAMVSIGTLLIVGGASAFKFMELRGGGHVVAERLGGELLSPNSSNPMERRILNVVEEMAIASGVPTPPVYLMRHEEGINAFAAGTRVDNAVIGVTKGCAEQLKREQLQGVMAHEFSHILNGDMRLNLRIMAVVYGILVLGILGYYVMRTAPFAGRSRDRKEGGGAMAWLLLGLGLTVIGFLGTFFGNLIKAAVSRQREFLADASAVQFTRNPQGIAGALRVIGGYEAGSRMQHPRAVEASHLFFGSGLGLSSLFATHPPLPERIKRVDPSWKGDYTEASGVAELHSGAISGFTGGQSSISSPPPVPPRVSEKKVVEQVGQFSEEHLQYAAQLIREIPDEVARSAREPYGARAVIFAMLISTEVPTRRAQLSLLKTKADLAVQEETKRLLPFFDDLHVRVRLPLLDLALPVLRLLSEQQKTVFLGNVDALIEADGKVDLFEWTLRRILISSLRQRELEGRYPIGSGKEACQVVLSSLAYFGHQTLESVDAGLQQASQELGFGVDRLSPEECGLQVLDQALDALSRVNSEGKQRLLRACAACVSSNGEVNCEEAEILRAIAVSFGCPIPPLLPGQKVL